MLHPQLPTFKTASSSSSSAEFDVLSRPSDEPDSRICPDMGDELFFIKFTVVMSSECVEPWTRSGTAGLRGSLLFYFEGQSLCRVGFDVPVEDKCILLLQICPGSHSQAIIRGIAR